MPKPTPRDLAKKNLLRALKAVGGQFNDDLGMAEFSVGKYEFEVDPWDIYAWRSGRSLGNTCFNVDGVLLPHEERIASAVLALHNNPRLFLYWQRNWEGEYRI